jgi:WD40 repeat protein
VGRQGVSPKALDARADMTLPHAAEVFAAAFSPDGRVLATLGIETLTFWSCKPHGYELIEQKQGGSHLCLAWAPDGRSLAIGLTDGTIQLLNMPGARQRMVLAGHTKMVRRLAFAPDGRILASSSMDGKVKLWDVALGRELMTVAETAGAFHAIAFSPDGCSLALAEYGTRPADVILWDLKANLIRSLLAGHTDGISSLSFSHDGRILASGSLDQTMRLWDPGTGKALAVLRDPVGKIRSLALSPDGTRLAYSHGQMVKVWDLDLSIPLRTQP